MRGTAISTISLLIFGAAAALAAGPDYFPLEAGNQWIYRGSGSHLGKTLTLEISELRQFNERWYLKLQGMPQGPFWLRRDEAGSLVAYDPGLNRETVWYAFEAPEAQVFDTTAPGNCCGKAEIVSRKAEYQGPVGDFTSVLAVSYPGAFQVGVARDLFLPYVGLVRRDEATGEPGTGAWDLIYARLGGITEISEPHVSFGIALDKAQVTVNMMPPVDPNAAVPQLTARLRLRNTTPAPLVLNFSSGQTYDLVLRNEHGEIVYRWSDGMAFIQIVQRAAFPPGSDKNFVITVPLADKSGKVLPQGRYTVEGWLTTTEGKLYSATAPVEILYAF